MFTILSLSFCYLDCAPFWYLTLHHTVTWPYTSIWQTDCPQFCHLTFYYVHHTVTLLSLVLSPDCSPFCHPDCPPFCNSNKSVILLSSILSPDCPYFNYLTYHSVTLPSSILSPHCPPFCHSTINTFCNLFRGNSVEESTNPYNWKKCSWKPYRQRQSRRGLDKGREETWHFSKGNNCCIVNKN